MLKMAIMGAGSIANKMADTIHTIINAQTCVWKQANMYFAKRRLL